MYANNSPHALEPRFQEPIGWRWHHFTRNGRKIRFGSVFPKDSIPDAVVVCLPGLSEYAEKYYEVARDLNDKNMAFWIIDWMGQGGSGRYLPNTSKRHSTGFQKDVDDLHYFIMEYIKHSSVHPDKGRIPLAMLGHSMGGNIGIHYLAQHPDMFECAAFSAPLAGIRQFSAYPAALINCISALLNCAASTSYAFGQTNWHEQVRPTPGYDEFSSDEKRGALQCLWWDINPDLRSGGVTFGWLHAALKACKSLKKTVPKIQTPTLVALAEHDIIVDNKAIKDACKKNDAIKIIQLNDAKHEILMETDAVRDIFLNGFYELITRHIISRPEAMKKF